MSFPNHVYFSTFTINNWISIFESYPESNFIITDSLYYLSENKDISIYAFIIMRDHLHIIWDLRHTNISEIEKSFKQFTGRKISNFLNKNNSDYLNYFISDRKDRNHKIWKTSSGKLRLQSKEIYYQKLDYIHMNPIKGNYMSVKQDYDYLFSSARSYFFRESNFSFLTIYLP